MSGLAEILLQRKFTVYGSDIKNSDMTEMLKSLGAVINIGQVRENITDDIDFIVYTAAISKDNEEYKAKIELLSNNKKRYENPTNKEDEKEIINVYNENYDKCSKISDKIMADFSLIFTDYINIGELMRCKR